MIAKDGSALGMNKTCDFLSTRVGGRSRLYASVEILPKWVESANLCVVSRSREAVSGKRFASAPKKLGRHSELGLGPREIWLGIIKQLWNQTW